MIIVSEFVIPSSPAISPWRRRTRQRRLAAARICGAIFFITLVPVIHSGAADPGHDRIASRIPHRPIESSAITAVGYSSRLRALEIEFKRGGTYRYLDVPPSVYRNLLAAESKARFYNRHVRGKYRSVHVRVGRGP